MAKIVVDLHRVYNDGETIDDLMRSAVESAARNGVAEVEIIHGKGSGQLKKKVLRFLNEPHIKSLYKRVKKDPLNHGRLFVYF